MSDWRVVKMSMADAVIGRHIELQRAFAMMYYSIGAPQAVALFLRYPMGNDPDSFLEIYFSPASVYPCANVIAAYAGQAATKPPKEQETSLLVGHQGAWNSLLS